jgi:hypothetical protein
MGRDKLPAVLLTATAVAVLLTSCQSKPTTGPVTKSPAQNQPPAPSVVVASTADRSNTSKPAPPERAPKAPPADEPAAQEPSPKAAKALDALEKLGVYVSNRSWTVDLMFVREPEAVDRAVALLADLDHVYELTLGRNATDAHVAAAGKLKDLRVLTVQRSEHVSDKGLEALKGLTNLKGLGLYEVTKVTPAGMASLATLTGLESLALYGIRTGDEINRLAALTSLRDLSLRFSIYTLDAIPVISRLKGLRKLDISGQSDFDENTLKPLAGLTELESLELACVKMPEAGFRHLAGLTKLTALDLSDSKFGDAAMKEVGKLTGLRDLNLTATPVTDAGLKHLEGMTKLEHLYLKQTKVTAGGVGTLQGKLKGAEIVFER